MSNYIRKKKPINVVHRSFFSRNFFLLVIFLTLFAIIHIIQRNNIKNMLAEISQLDSRITTLKEENSELQKDLHRLASNEEIRKKAMNVLKMVELTEPPKVVFYQDQFAGKQDMLSSLVGQEELIYQNPSDLIDSIKE